MKIGRWKLNEGASFTSNLTTTQLASATICKEIFFKKIKNKILAENLKKHSNHDVTNHISQSNNNNQISILNGQTLNGQKLPGLFNATSTTTPLSFSMSMTTIPPEPAPIPSTNMIGYASTSLKMQPLLQINALDENQGCLRTDLSPVTEEDLVKK